MLVCPPRVYLDVNKHCRSHVDSIVQTPPRKRSWLSAVYMPFQSFFLYNRFEFVQPTTYSTSTILFEILFILEMVLKKTCSLLFSLIVIIVVQTTEPIFSTGNIGTCWADKSIFVVFSPERKSFFFCEVNLGEYCGKCFLLDILFRQKWHNGRLFLSFFFGKPS